MYLEFLDQPRKNLWQALSAAVPTGVLGGGTAIAMQINHRVSYDFDIFFTDPIPQKLLREVNRLFNNNEIRPIVDSVDELSVVIGDIKVTFLYYPFPPLHEPIKTNSLSLFHLNDLASNKAYTIGRRPVYRDYVDLFFLLNGKFIRLPEVISEAQQRFQGNFNEKLFLEQLTYLEDIESFEIEFIGTPYTPEEVKECLESEVKNYTGKRFLKDKQTQLP